MTGKLQEQLVDEFEFSAPLLETWSYTDDFSENKGIVDGKNYLARVSGPAFLINANSRNGRHYSRGLWENAIASSKPKITSGMLGTIGHEQPLDDKALREGKASHRVSKLWIDESKNLGMVEVLVLNTSAGRELNGLLRGGVKFPVSSRAFGDLTGRKINNADEIDPKTYQLETFDFVRVPGVAQAVPSLVESSKDGDINTNANEHSLVSGTEELKFTESKKMSNELLENVTREKVKLESDLNSAISTNENLSVKVKLSEEKVELAEKEVTTLKDSLAETKNELAEAKTNASDLADKILVLESSLELDKEQNEDRIKESEEALSGFHEKYGNEDHLKSTFELLEGWSEEFGGADGITEALEKVRSYEELGSVEELVALVEAHQAYIALGSVESLEKVLTETKKVQEELYAKKQEEKIKGLSESHGVKKSIVAKLFESVKDSDAVTEILESMGESSKDTTKKEDDVSENFKKVEESETKTTEESKVSNLLNESSTSKLFSRFN